MIKIVSGLQLSADRIEAKSKKSFTENMEKKSSNEGII